VKIVAMTGKITQICIVKEEDALDPGLYAIDDEGNLYSMDEKEGILRWNLLIPCQRTRDVSCVLPEEMADLGGTIQ